MKAKHCICIGLTALGVLAGTARVLGRAGEHPLDRPVGGSPQWPVGLKGLIESAPRVDGYFVNANDFFQYRGPTQALNLFLARYAGLGGTPLTVVLHAGKGQVRKGWGARQPQPCDWKLSVLRRGRHPQAPKQRGAEGGLYVVMVDVWLGGDVQLDGLKAPLNVEVRSGGEIEKFIAAHKAEQKKLRPPAEQPTSRPTTQPASRWS